MDWCKNNCKSILCTRNSRSLKRVNATVMVKNPLHPELSLWMGAIERLMMVGVKDRRQFIADFLLWNSPFQK